MVKTRSSTDSGYLGTAPDSTTYDTMVIGGYAHRIHKVMVHQFMMGDVEDPDLYAAEPIINWQNSEEGKWVMAHAIETPEWHRMIDHTSFGYRYGIVAKLKGRDYTYWVMKWKKMST